MKDYTIKWQFSRMTEDITRRVNHIIETNTMVGYEETLTKILVRLVYDKENKRWVNDKEEAKEFVDNYIAEHGVRKILKDLRMQMIDDMLGLLD